MTVTSRMPAEINASRHSPEVEIVWDDGHRSLYPVGYLRDICPCATCRETPEGSLASSSKQNRRSLPMFKIEKYTIAEMNFVGNYALGVNWQDKHRSIYPWSMLSVACRCGDCASEPAK